MNGPSKLLIHRFDRDNPLLAYADTAGQVSYLHAYLCELGAQSVVEEPNYFDRDYLAEHEAFYSISSKGYPNVCRRLHFFSENITRDTIRRAAANSVQASRKLQESYLGFVVLRPIPAAPLGRTVLRWFHENRPALPRVTTPSREYIAHLAGIELKVVGLAWQQQDTAVGACATVGLWTLLHSSSFDDLHAIPTTVEITRSANNRATWGSPIFPSKGLVHFQLFDAISDQGLMPMIVEGDTKKNGVSVGFGRSRFVSNCASFIRSGYPVLLWVVFPDLPSAGSHIVVVGGLRSSTPGPSFTENVLSDDIGMEYIYIHDDNIGPHARMKIQERDVDGQNVVELVHESPPLTRPNLFQPYQAPYGAIIPTRMYVAAHSEVRLTPDHFNKMGLWLTHWMHTQLSNAGWLGQLVFSTRYIKVCDYLGEELSRSLGGTPRLLAKARLKLTEKVAPMSLHIGLLRIGFKDGSRLIDVLFDTTDSDRNMSPFASVCYLTIGAELARIGKLDRNICLKRMDFGVIVKAY